MLSSLYLLCFTWWAVGPGAILLGELLGPSNLGAYSSFCWVSSRALAEWISCAPMTANFVNTLFHNATISLSLSLGFHAKKPAVIGRNDGGLA